MPVTNGLDGGTSARELLLIVGTLALGGAERSAVVLASYWADRGNAVSVLTYAPSIQDHFQLPANVRRVSVDLMWPSSGLLAKATSAVRRHRLLRRHILEIAPDVVIAFGDLTSIRSLISCCFSRIPVLACERTDPRQHHLPWPWRVLRRLLYPFAESVVVQTEAVACWARGVVPPARVRVIPNPVVPLRCSVAKPSAMGSLRTVIAAGRLGREKGFDLLLLAFARSSLQREEWQLVILGEGPERASLERQVTQLGLRDSVLMPGALREPRAWMQHADLFVLPSRYEGFPNALLEAMSCELAVAAFDCPSGPSEIVSHEQTGLLLPPGDVDALSDAMARLAIDADLRRRLGSAAAIDVAVRFSVERVGAMWEDLWTSSLAGAGLKADSI